MKPLSILNDTEKLSLNNSGTIFLAKLLPVREIKLQREFKELFPIVPGNLEKIITRMRESGFDNSKPLHIWNKDGTYILIDGHHRREAAITCDLHEVPCYLHSFESTDEALEYALSEQTERRNLSDADLLKALKVVDELKARGPATGEKGKSAARSAQILGISTSRVEKTRTVEKFASEEIKQQIESGELTLNKAYQMVRENQKPESTAKKEKKISKDVIKVIQIVRTYLQDNDIEGLNTYIQNQLIP